jgi:adenylate cyclase
VDEGYWFVVDRGSRNGTKVNGVRISTSRKRLDPGDTLAVAKHKYEVRYSPVDDLGAVGPPPAEEEPLREIMGKSLLDRAGLKRRRF